MCAFSHILVLIVLCVASATKEINLVIGLAGAGKTTIVGRVCGRPVSPEKFQNGIDAGTLQVEEFDCGGQILVDTVGLMHMAKDVKIEDAYFEGLNGLLKYMDGKKVGRIYIVTDSNYIRDSAARVLDQVDFLKSVVNPLIPWTGVINCINGICPSSLPAESRPEFQTLLRERVSNMIEVVSPHLQDVPTELFPVPHAYFPVDLPDHWESLIQSHKISSLREDMDTKARMQCDEYKIVLEKTKEKTFACSIATCQVADCNTLPACAAAPCTPCQQKSECKLPSHPLIDKHTFFKNKMLFPKDNDCTRAVDQCNVHSVFPCNSDCKRTRTKKYRCGFLHLETCYSHDSWDDHDCIHAMNECHQRQTDSCNNHNTVRNACLTERDASCIALVNTHAECVSTRNKDCATQLTAHNEAKNIVLTKHRPLYERCVMCSYVYVVTFKF